MKTSWIAAVVACTCLFSLRTFAHAQDTGLDVGLRVGYGIPLGDASDGQDLSLGISGQIPLSIDLGYRIIPNLSIGLYAQYGFGFLGSLLDECEDSSAIDCSVHDIRLGIQAHYHFQPREKLDPWIGLGFGYEWLGFKVEGGGVAVSQTIGAFEFFNLQAGLDIQVVEHFYIGPFVTLAVGQYDSMSIDCSSGAASVCDQLGTTIDVESKALHEWLLLGVRGAYAP